MATVAAIRAITKAANVAQRDSFDACGAGEEALACAPGEGSAAGAVASDSGEGSAACAAEDGSAACAGEDGSVGEVSDIGRWYRSHLAAGGCLGVKK
jgi:hypothetical protein